MNHIEILNQVRDILSVGHHEKNYQQVIKITLDKIANIIPYSVAAVTLSGEREMIVNICEDVSSVFLDKCMDEISLHLRDIVPPPSDDRAPAFKKIICESNLDFDGGAKPADDIAYQLLLPLENGDVMLGSIAIFSTKSSDDSDFRTVIEILSSIISVQIVNAYLVLQHEQHMLELSILNKVSKKLNSILNLDRLLDIIASKSAEMLRATRASIVFYDQSSDSFQIKSGLGVPKEYANHYISTRDNTVINYIARGKKSLLVTDIQAHEELASCRNGGPYKTESFIALPLKIRNRVVGVLSVSDKTDGGAFSTDDLELIETFVSQAAISVENAILYYEMEQLAITDGLTKAYNHKYFQEDLEKEIHRAERYRLDISLLMVDIDHFKRVNDTYGHPDGDKVLVSVANIIKSTVRNTDTVARYGGEEFVITMPETDSAESYEVAMRIKENITQSSVTIHKGVDIGVTISIGLSSFFKGDTVKERSTLIDRADQALYSAKEAGRNRIVVFDPNKDQLAPDKS